MNKPTYKEDPKYFENRNDQIIQDKKNGMSMKSMVIKYDLSDTRIRTILLRYSRKFKGAK